MPAADKKVLDALFEFMHTGKDPNAVDQMIVKFVENLKVKYGAVTSTTGMLSFDHYMEIATFQFDDESVEDLVTLIRHFDSLKQPNFHTTTEGTTYAALSNKNFTIEIDEVYFNIKLRQMIDNMFQSIEDYQVIDNQQNYIRLLTICTESSKMFQHFYKLTAKQMIESQFPDSIQAFLKQLLFDIRIRKNNYAEFNRMYDDDLVFYVEIISEFFYGCDDSQAIDGGSQNPIICDILKNLRRKDFQRFVILITHFDQFRYLLDEFEIN